MRSVVVVTTVAVLLGGSPTSASTPQRATPDQAIWDAYTAALAQYGLTWSDLEPWMQWTLWRMMLSGTMPPGSPSPAPAPAPSASPTAVPSPAPSSAPTAKPSPSPSATPSTSPTSTPSPSPSSAPSPAPTSKPSPSPTSAPSPAPTSKPTATPTPTPTPAPTATPAPSAKTVVDGDLVVTEPGTVIDSVDVRGYIRVEAANVTIKNSVVRGRTGLASNTGLVTNLDGYPNLVIQDSELAAAQATPYINGFMGSNATLLRVSIHDVVDSVHVTGSNVVIDSSRLFSNLHFASDPNQGGAPSHDDNVQIQAGSNIVIKNSAISGAKNAAIMVTQDRGDVDGLVIKGNKLDNGACTINLAEKTYGPIAATISGNSFGTGQVFKYCAIKASSTTTAVSSVVSNTFTDGRTFAVTP